MNLMKYRWLFVGIFTLTMILAVSFWVGLGLNKGVDFEGGTNIRFPLASNNITSDQVEKVLTTSPELKGIRSLKLSSPQPYSYVDGQGNQRYGVLVHTRFLNKTDQKAVISALESAYGSAKDSKGLDVYGVDPFFGKELLRNAFWAIILSWLLILVYIWFRFEFVSGVAGVIALIHDVLVVVGVFALLHKEVNATFVAAALTIIAYSIHDTIVIFDRIRENLRFRRKGESFSDVVNYSLLQTIRRSLNTSFVVILSILVLYLVGGPSIRDFCLALLVGITSGTYSSIFVAPPIWAVYKDWQERKSIGKIATANAK